MEQLTGVLERDRAQLDLLLGTGINYDVISRSLEIGGRRAHLYVIDGYGDDGVLERVTAFLMGDATAQAAKAQTMQELVDRCISFSEVNCESGTDQILTGILLGKTALLVDGFPQCALIDAKHYPGRNVEEPADGKVLRGSHDGFTETLVQNTALLRRRIRDSRLRLENHKLRNASATDVVIAYLDGKADTKLLNELRQKLAAIDVGSISMGQESVAEAMMKPQWYNPFPKVRYTERPDAATASLMDGNIILLVDNSPAVMLLPTCFFDFLEEANDYYFPPLVGTYLRWLRLIVMVLALLITPVWYLLARDPGRLPDMLRFIAPEEPGSVPLFVQLLLVELVVDLLKLASLNTPDALSSSFSMLGALILGDFAVQARWLVPEVLVYMAFVAIANFAQPSFELGYALKLMRIVLLFLSALLDLWGLAAGLLLLLVLLMTTRPVLSHSYLYPLYPFNAKALSRILIRHPIDKNNS